MNQQYLLQYDWWKSQISILVNRYYFITTNDSLGKIKNYIRSSRYFLNGKRFLVI